MEKISCIYFMFLRGKLIYIGETSNLRSRMYKHTLEFEHDCFRYIRCTADKKKRKEYEKRLIKILKPLKNTHHNTNNLLVQPLDPHWEYNVPKWMYYYEKIKECQNALKWDKRLSEEARDILNHKIQMLQMEFDFNYKKYGFKGTYLEDKYYYNANIEGKRVQDTEERKKAA